MNNGDYLSPYSDSTRWLRGNLHAHTCCGRFMDLSVSGRIYAGLGYDFLAVTDHNKPHPPEQIRQWQEQAGLIVLPGEENGSSDHIIELGVHELGASPEPSTGYARRAGDMRQAGGFVFGCHPQEYQHGDRNIREGAEALHAVEIYNALREARGTEEPRNVRLWDELLSDGARLWAVACDDFHCQYVGPGQGWVQVQVPEDAEPTWELIVDQLKRGAFYASTYPTFERLMLREGTLHVAADKHTRELRVIGPGGQVLAEAAERELTWQPPAGISYFRVEARCGLKRAWSQPFFHA